MDFMSYYKVEYSFAKSFGEVVEWFSFDDYFKAENAKCAAEDAACTDGFRYALFKVRRVEPNECGIWDTVGEPKYFSFDEAAIPAMLQLDRSCKNCKYPCEYTGKDFKPITINELYDMGYILCDYYTEEDD